MKRVDQLLSGLADASMRDAMQADERLRESISRIVPPETMTRLAFCRLEGEVLHLCVADAVWLTRLRFVERTLLDRLSREGWAVRSLKGHVLPRRSPVRQRRAVRPAPANSTQGADGIRQLANSLDEGRLKEALRQMARHVGGKSNDF